RIEAAHQPPVLGRDAGRAMAGVTALRLDAADREHRLAADVDQVAAEREREQRALGKAELARADPDDLVLRAGRGEHLVELGETELERQCDVVAEHEWRGAGAAFAAIDRDEVGPAPGFADLSGEVAPESEVADRALDPDRQAGRVGE